MVTGTNYIKLLLFSGTGVLQPAQLRKTLTVNLYDDDEHAGGNRTRSIYWMNISKILQGGKGTSYSHGWVTHND
jgi:hypothetical protein